jgi:hypothetical protein
MRKFYWVEVGKAHLLYILLHILFRAKFIFCPYLIIYGSDKFLQNVIIIHKILKIVWQGYLHKKELFKNKQEEHINHLAKHSTVFSVATYFVLKS